jgi:hypothetical protein
MSAFSQWLADMVKQSDFEVEVEEDGKFQPEPVFFEGVRSTLGAHRISARNCKNSNGPRLISCKLRH